MKRTLLLLTLGALLATPFLAKADDSTPPSGPPPEGGPGGHHHPDLSFLTEDQKAELKKDHDAVFAADPSLATEEQELKASHQEGTPPTEEEMEKMKAFHDKVDEAMIKLDPAVAPIIAEIKEHMHHGHGPGGPPPPASSGTTGT
jgi:Spy/CpxP family protein refolding chaperone